MNNDVIVQWSYDFIKSFYLNNNETMSETEKAYYHYLSPYSGKYFSVLNPFLIFGGANVSLLYKKKSWFIRDGLIPLSFFFKDAPSDLLELERVFYIHKDYWFLVPLEWRPFVKFYDFQTKKKYKRGVLPQKIVICGMANDTLSDPNEFIEEIEKLAKIYTLKELEKIEIIGYFPNKRTDLWGRWQDENIFKYAQVLFKKLKIDISFPEWEIILSTSTFENTLYFEINKGTIIKDSFVQQMMFSKGAGQLEEEPNETFFTLKDSIPLSMYHSVNIYDCDYSLVKKINDPLKDEMFPYFKKIIEKGSSQRIISEGWEKWYGSYIKKNYKSHGLI
jgi:hypothetical protein